MAQTWALSTGYDSILPRILSYQGMDLSPSGWDTVAV